MASWLEVIARSLPLFLFISLGMLLRKSKLIRKEAIPEIKKLIVHITLPAMLLLTFAGTTFRSEYILLFAIIFLFCCLMLAFGVLLGKKISPENRFFPALFTGFEAGMMGYALFSTFFGARNNFAFAIIDIGQVLFVFFVLVFYLRKKSGTDASLLRLVKGFAVSPIILCIGIGILLGSTGIYHRVSDFPLVGAVEDTLKLLGGMTQPLICLVIGYDLNIRISTLRRPLFAVLLRLFIMIVAAYLINTVVIESILHLDKIFSMALYTLFILPPPFVIPVYLEKASILEKEEILDTLSLHTVVSLAAFIALLSRYG